jgi:hypothetical protein
VRTPTAASGENCPNCDAGLAPDQRYCLACGQRRGDPRLPFMDAVVFMESAKRPVKVETPAAPAPARPDRRPIISANASLVAGVATLVLAIGVGVLIGRSGEGGSSNAAAPAPQIIRVGGGGGEVASTSNAKEGKGSTSIGGGGKSKSTTKKKAQKKLETGDSGTTKAVEEVYEPAPGVKIAPPEQQVGGKCDPSVAGCGDNGKFEGTFFE